jgi:hypothetical protein
MLRSSTEILSREKNREQDEINTHEKEKSAPIQKKMKYTYIIALFACMLWVNSTAGQVVLALVAAGTESLPYLSSSHFEID